VPRRSPSDHCAGSRGRCGPCAVDHVAIGCCVSHCLANRVVASRYFAAVTSPPGWPDRPGVPCISSCARGITAHIASPPSGRCPLPAHPKPNLISRRNFSLQVLEHRQMHLDHHAGQDSDVFVIVSGQNRIQESLLDVQQLLVTDDLTLNIGDVKDLA
jgi:hypothetical protein